MTSDGRDELFDLLPPLDSHAGPAKRISSKKAASMIEAVLHAHAAATESPVTPSAPPRRRRILLLAAAFVAFAGVASAGVYQWQQVVAQGRKARADRAKPATLPPATEPQLEPATEAEPEPEPTSVKPPPVRRQPARRQPVRAKPDAGPETPEDYLRLANSRRRTRRWRDADRLYQRVLREHPGSTAAHVARVASASIRLEQLDDPDSALRLYRAAVREQPDGPLAEEARFGVAEAYRSLGRSSEEIQALQELIAAHPDSALRYRAEARLRGLIP